MNKIKKYIFLIIYLFIITLIFFFALRNGEQSTTDSGRLIELLYKIIKLLKMDHIIDASSLAHVVRKLIGHFGLFFVCGLFGCFTFHSFISDYKKALLFHLLSGLLIAIISELLQLIPLNRSCQFTDVLIDYSGYIVCTAIYVLIIYLIKKKQLKN